MPLQATSGAASYDAFGGGVPVVPAYIEECFSCFLYTGTGSAQTITNGIDLAGKGGLVVIKGRDSPTGSSAYGGTANQFTWQDTVRGITQTLCSNRTDAQLPAGGFASNGSISSTGFTLDYNGYNDYNRSPNTYASWTFRKQPKFFDVVTWTADGTTNRQIPHNLGSAPGFITCKRTDSTGNWRVYHSSQSGMYANLEDTGGFQTDSVGMWASVTSTYFISNYLNGFTGATFVTYLFASNAGGFGLTGTDNVISCGSYVGNDVTSTTVTLGYEPQWIMIKRATGTTSAYTGWAIFDNMRGMPVSGNDNTLLANTSDAENPVTANNAFVSPTATGFTLNIPGSNLTNTGETFIYIAIRRGPMKVPTDATKVFAPVLRTGTGADANVSTGNLPDWVIIKQKLGSSGNAYSRLQGPNRQLYTESTLQEIDQGAGYGVTSFLNTAFTLGLDANAENQNGRSIINWTFSRAPSFFDEVCYTGTGSVLNVTHNLGVVPELMIVKNRTSAYSWSVYSAALGNTKYLFLNSTNPPATDSGQWNNTTPNSSVFTVNGSNNTGSSGSNFVAYLFATCAGVSKVGSYTGDNTDGRIIDCGFTSGARFILIRNVSSSGGQWAVWDSARGIVSGNDPYLILNLTVAQINGFDDVDATSTGFIVNATSPGTPVNVAGEPYIFLAIA